ncbi:effector [Candidatus Phytoplasma fabacearum]|nr:effector ['Bituminaria bituminosa' little leaf phytoplasma]MDV3154117.1 effector [Pigeon pea little leaf phytoplasma]MDO8030691.1 effector ['Bituminaria bituminosa' little leaf phytoplasma]MDV3163380.1 effector [Pigeon pea little leaf phytoplasma]MDV3188971.1 effector [Pigeon pea little leaf phytoplasma]MDV3200328.1 effector [Pigeon pea little leaf phytoplasma]
MIIKKNNFLIFNNLLNNDLNHIPKMLQKQPKSESKKEENLKISHKYHHLLNFIKKISLKYQNKIKKINNKLHLYQKDYYVLNKELRHYENLEKIFNNKIVLLSTELNKKKQTLIENKIYSFKKASLVSEKQQLQDVQQKHDDMKPIIKAKRDQIQNLKIKIIDLLKYKNIYFRILYDLNVNPKDN